MNRAMRAARLSVASNGLLVVVKLAVGLYSGSISVLSEAIHSGIDLVAAVIATFSIQAARRPADEEHRYGHGKIENLSALVEALLIIVAAGWIVWEASTKLFTQHAAPAVTLGLWVMGGSAAINWAVSSHLMRVAREEDSMALDADGWHLRTDVWTSIGVFLGLGAVRLTGLAWLDPVVALLMALMIVKAAWSLTRAALQPLVDTRLPDDEEHTIRTSIEEHAAGFVEYHNLRTRRSGYERHVDLHLVVHRELPLERVHYLCDRIESAIQTRFPHCQVLIHPEPCAGDCPSCRGR